MTRDEFYRICDFMRRNAGAGADDTLYQRRLNRIKDLEFAYRQGILEIETLTESKLVSWMKEGIPSEVMGEINSLKYYITRLAFDKVKERLAEDGKTFGEHEEEEEELYERYYDEIAKMSRDEINALIDEKYPYEKYLDEENPKNGSDFSHGEDTDKDIEAGLKAAAETTNNTPEPLAKVEQAWYAGIAEWFREKFPRATEFVKNVKDFFDR